MPFDEEDKEKEVKPLAQRFEAHKQKRIKELHDRQRKHHLHSSYRKKAKKE